LVPRTRRTWLYLQSLVGQSQVHCMHMRVFGLALLSARRGRGAAESGVWFQRITALLLTSGHNSYAFLRRASQVRWKRDLAAFLLSLAKRGILHALGQAQSSIQETKRDKLARAGPGRVTARLPITPLQISPEEFTTTPAHRTALPFISLISSSPSPYAIQTRDKSAAPPPFVFPSHLTHLSPTRARAERRARKESRRWAGSISR
jgi:hypothetical protein